MANTTQREQIFFSYSHKDKKWLELFQAALKPLVKANQFSVWDDTKIKAGDVWRDEIMQALASAKVAVLLVSMNFYNSDFIAENELPPLLEAARNEGLKILLVIVGHSLFDETELGRYQAVNDPSKPLATMTAASREKEIVRICREIKAAILGTQVGYRRSSMRVPQEEVTPTLSSLTVNFGTSHSDSALSVPLPQFCKHTALIGMSGSGKTTALNWLTELLWRRHGIPFLAIRHWQGIPLGEGITHLCLEPPEASDTGKPPFTYRLDTENKIVSRLEELQANMGVEYLSKSPTVLDIRLEKWDFVRTAFQLLWTRIVSSLTLNHQSDNLRFVIVIDEFDHLGSQIDFRLFGDNLRDLRRCGIGLLLSCGGYNENLLREVRNFIIFSYSDYWQFGPSDALQAIKVDPDLRDNLRMGKAVFFARGLISPTIISIPYTKSRLAVI